MVSSQNLPAIEPWIFRSSFPDSWISKSFARDNEILIKALQVSLEASHLQTASPAIPIQSPELAIRSYSGVDLTGNNPKRINSIPVKNKSRKSKRAGTTIIMADTENFRQIVQEVTGGGHFMPIATPLLKPEPKRLFNLTQGFLPTLDTSAFLLDDKHQPPPMVGSPAVNFDSFSCFPTLESWKVIY
ncbi:calmodulin-binding protein 25-like [Impatiens glandulifera]|uniref:calmodulin-binding protein 25-like n=1 Tax=Impatiens glandulifera TaxID=253017 RepID=UPI001FB15920|nr:calmodulin-binding protein 25-like [Impatiens glandulifera]